MVDPITLASTDSSVDLQARVPAVALNGDYIAYVDMPPNGAAAVFDTRGKFVSTIGSPGGGPGEFHQITSAGFGVADTIWILDRMVTAHAFSPAPIVRYVRSVKLDHVTLGQITALGIIAPSALYGEVVRPATLTGWDGHEAARFGSEHRKANADRVMGPVFALDATRAWTASGTAYAVDLVNRRGDALQHLARSVAWFPAHTGMKGVPWVLCVFRLIPARYSD